jgi:hypothetical protein
VKKKIFHDDVIDILSGRNTYNNFMIGVPETSQESDNTDNWLFGKIKNEKNQTELGRNM